VRYLILLLFSISFSSHAEEVTEIYCNIAHQSNQSELRIIMGAFSPVELALRSPGQQEYRTQDMNIENVINDYASVQHTFMAKPNITTDMIDWSQTTSCYVEVGTQWYFEFNYEMNLYQVQLVPHYIKKDEQDRTCVTPRVPPQTKALLCY